MAEIVQLKEGHKDTRDKIAATATHLFALHGFDATTTRDIALNAGVTKPVLYYYFHSKENLFVTLISEAYDFFYDALEKIIAGEGDFEDRLRRVTHLYFDLSRQYGDTFRLIYMTAFGPHRSNPNVDIFELEKKHFAFLERLFMEGIEKGYVRELAIESIILLYLGSISVYLQTLLFTNNSLPEQSEETILNLVFHGIGGGKS